MQGIVPLVYNLKKAQADVITNESLYQGMVRAFVTGNIGIYSNNISKIWNKNNISDESLKIIKWLVFENNACIDTAKTLWMPERPNEINEIIKTYTKGKVPNFFKYAKDKRGEPKTKKEKEINLPSQVEQPNQSPMNRIAAKIPDSKIKFSKSVGKFDYRMLMNLDFDFSIMPENSVIKSYDYWNARQSLFNEEEDNKKDQDLYKYKQIREKIIKDCNQDLNYIVNTLIAVLYTTRKTSGKKTLWACFGDIIVKNLKNNLDKNYKICQICGKRFLPKRISQNYCSEECLNKARITKTIDARNNK